ncbi:WXG100-like domain-containing protein [Nocardioides lacusdianchii]|uniref:WXG100-like domain-containing protein n=1 Tax=Nocardioides lacusdianchii TaxID=2783664 RepID=UPI001CCEAF87|nr:hypothetical protein [Nocardioides lacusdianchii]
MTVKVQAIRLEAAADHFATANGFAAQTYQGLTDAVGGFSGMAGDDYTSDEFVSSYDEAAQAAVDGVRELVAALAGMARLLWMTAGNHRSANRASVYQANPPVYDGGQFDDLPDTTVTVGSVAVPTAKGAESSDTPALWDLITDYLEGWTWPGANTGTLRSAASSWRQLQTMLDTMLVPCLEAAESELEGQRSPEIADVRTVIADLKLDIEQLGLHCKDLGDACDDYATHVDTVKETVKGILQDLAIEAGITVVAAGVVTFFTAGLGAGGGAAVAGWRLASAARRVIKAFTAMRAAVKVAAVAKLTRVASKVPLIGRRFRRISDAANVAKHARYKDALRRAMGKPATRNPKLSRLMDEMWRDNAKIGNGSTAAAVRHELATGKPVGGVFHTQKAQDMIRALEKWLRNNPEATPGDRAAAENVIKDLRDALAGN